MRIFAELRSGTHMRCDGSRPVRRGCYLLGAMRSTRPAAVYEALASVCHHISKYAITAYAHSSELPTTTTESNRTETSS